MRSKDEGRVLPCPGSLGNLCRKNPQKARLQLSPARSRKVDSPSPHHPLQGSPTRLISSLSAPTESVGSGGCSPTLPCVRFSTGYWATRCYMPRRPAFLSYG